MTDKVTVNTPGRLPVEFDHMDDLLIALDEQGAEITSIGGMKFKVVGHTVKWSMEVGIGRPMYCARLVSE